MLIKRVLLCWTWPLKVKVRLLVSQEQSPTTLYLKWLFKLDCNFLFKIYKYYALFLLMFHFFYSKNIKIMHMKRLFCMKFNSIKKDSLSPDNKWQTNFEQFTCLIEMLWIYSIWINNSNIANIIVLCIEISTLVLKWLSFLHQNTDIN